ncbi:PLP-dependent aminotransferase family protein [Herbaspirillum robiniae]|uniref:PLP-dependent aminotransferase family protein n=1 Tax=Herbaspirillum robiniae TaxID=2014887 RepID=A0ABX2LYP2_9BURK|nr:PLP-dependent aminotransferase family protein [Herbaspirillum robiniae]NUU03592.1 PLP-dependent aminotransferase family protein [Herbaspirillum robiniae]
MKLYEQLAETIRTQIEDGIMLEGEKIPSVRRTSQQYQLSISTVIRAYLLLESRGLIESRPQSGYFVRMRQAPDGAGLSAPAPQGAPHAVEPAAGPDMAPAALVLSNMRSINSADRIPLGSPYPDPSLFPSARISQLAHGFYKRRDRQELMGSLPPGNAELIRQVARRHLETGLAVNAAEIVITEGATEAIHLCLQAISRPGDGIAVEAPTYYALLHAIERIGMRAVPVATDPQNGIDLPSLNAVIESGQVAGAIVMPNFQNPMGFEMPEERKRALVDLMASHDLPLIENDVYGELHYAEQRPRPLKAFDRSGLVLYCSSFSKSLTPEHRIGWTLPGRYRQAVERLKFLNTVTMPSHPQRAIAEYLQNEGYDFHLRRLRKTLSQQERIMRSAVLRFFPPGTQCSEPNGGYLLWVTLPPGVQGMDLHVRAQAAGISVAPGNMFSTAESFGNCIRLNYSFAWNREIEQAVRLLGEITHELAAHAANLANAGNAANADLARPAAKAAAAAPGAAQAPASGLTKAS